jgi:hypothetical protein
VNWAYRDSPCNPANGELFVGMIFGEARAGRNYFDRHGEQAPTTLFD